MHGRAMMTSPRRPFPRRPDERGFTLIEIVVVTLLILVALSVAMPVLAPIIDFASLQGSATRLANYGRAAMEKCILARERYTVTFDLAGQEYWAVRWPTPEEPTSISRLLDPSGELDGVSLSDLFAAEAALEQAEEGGAQPKEGFTMEQKIALVETEMQRFYRASVEASTERIQDKNSLFSDFEPLFEERFELREGEDEATEIKDPLLRRTKLPDSIRIVSVQVGDKTHRSGEVEVEILPVGLMQTVIIKLEGDDDEVYTVEWDNLTNNGFAMQGEPDGA